MSLFSQFTACGSCCVKVLLGVVLVLALTAVHNLGVNWEKEITDVDVYTIQDPRFWGPMTMLVPRNCSKLEQMMKNRQPSSMSRLTNMTNVPATPPTNSPTSMLGYVKLPDTDILSLVAVYRCNKTIKGLNVTWSQYYWSAMITASSGFDINELHSCRMRLFWFYVVMAGFSYLTELGMTSYKTATALLDEEEAKGNCIEKGMKMILQQLSGKISTIMQQLAFVSLFVTYWHEDHYLMNYFPGRAMVVMTVCVQLPAMILTPYIQCMVGDPSQVDPDKIQALFLNDPILQILQAFQSMCVCICCCPVLLPMMGWTFYNLQFLYALFVGEHQEEMAFDASFPSMQSTLGTASKHLIGINLLDVIAGFLAEWAPTIAALAREIPDDAEGHSNNDPNEPFLQQQAE